MQHPELPAKLAVIDIDGRGTEIPAPPAMQLSLAALAAAERSERAINIATAFMMDAEAMLEISAADAAGDIRRLQIQANYESAMISLRSAHDPLERNVHMLVALVRKLLNA